MVQEMTSTESKSHGTQTLADVGQFATAGHHSVIERTANSTSAEQTLDPERSFQIRGFVEVLRVPFNLEKEMRKRQNVLFNRGFNWTVSTSSSYADHEE